MQSCHSPVSSVSAKKSGVPISLNGLFGETFGFEDIIHTSLQSPIHTNLTNNKASSISPSKSLSVELNYNQQPVLLSELADGNAYNNGGGSGLLLHGNTLCSFVSAYDNSRCTNLAVSKSDANVTKRKAVSKPIQPTAISSARKMNMSYGFVANNTITPASKTISATANGDGQTVASFPRTAASNIMFPVSYINAHNHQYARTKGKNTLSSVCNAIPVITAKSKEILKRPLSVQFKQESKPYVGTNNAEYSMDHGALQAFVDFLNQNSNKLTPKEQLSLLNSLGVAVATVKNPDDYCSMVHQQQPKSSNLVQNHVCRSPWNDACFSAVALPDQCHHEIPNTLKRKMPINKDSGSSSKKLKKTDNHTVLSSLQNLSSEELDERVLDTLTSIGAMSKSKNTKKGKIKSTPKSLSLKIDVSKSSPTPTVSISMNQSKNRELLKKDFSCKYLEDYVKREVDKETHSQNLFSLGPFCDDIDALVCTCKSNKQVVPIHSKSKQKQVKRTAFAEKAHCKCNCIDTRHPLMNFFDIALASTSKLQQEICDFNRNSCTSCSSTANQTPSYGDGDTNGTTGESLRKRCRHLTEGTKAWNDLLKEENKSLKQLVKSVQSNATECVKVVKGFGLQIPICLRKREKFGCMPSNCSLTDRTGNRCPNGTLPYAFFCRDHIMHSNNQQLFKLGPTMNVVADIYPDPPLVRQRKKTKLPPLSKRKKRRVKKRNKDSRGLVIQNEDTKSIEKSCSVDTPLQTKPKNVFHLSHSQPAISDYVVENNDDILTASKAVQMPSVIDYPPLSPKTKLLSDNMPSNVDEDSSSAFFEAFNFDGEEFLHDVTPDMFSELNLDNAFLLTGSGDSIDKLTFDELNDSESIFAAEAPAKEGEAHSAKDQTLDSTSPEQLNSSQTSISSDSQNLNWRAKPIENGVETDFTTNFADVGNVSTSLDASFAEDLNEIEGVLQSLQNETLKPTVADSRKNWSVDDYKNSLKQDASMNMQQRVGNLSGVKIWDNVESQQQSQMPAATTPLNAAVTLSVLPSANPVFTPSDTAKHTTNLHSTGLLLPNHQRAVLQKPDSRKPFENMNNSRSKSTKKSKTKTSPRKRTDIFTVRQNGLSQSVSMASRLQFLNSTAQTITTSKAITVSATPAPKLLTEKAKNGKKSKSIIACATPNSCSTTLRQSYPVRMQPIKSAASSGKASGQSMILIPINAVVRSPNQLQTTNQNLGIAFAIPTQNLGTSNLMQIRGSTFLTAATTNNNSQHVLILGATPTNNVQLSTNVGINSTIYQNTSVLSRSQQVPAGIMTNATAAMSSFNFNQKSKPCATQAGISSTNTQSTRTASSFPPVTTTSTNTVITTVTKNQPFNRQFNKESIVIPPVLNHGTKLHETSKDKSSSTTSDSVPAKPTRARSLESSSTVHWNKTMTTAPPPPLQRRPSDGVGGQTSNMLYCRRINPALNPHQHVVVGKLGSLARMNLPRLNNAVKDNNAVNESVKKSKSEAPPSNCLPADVGLPKQSFECPVACENGKCYKTTSRTTPWMSTQLGVKTSFSKSVPPTPVTLETTTSSSQLRDLSNQLLPINAEANRDLVGDVTSLPADPVSRHGSRKSDHSQMLKDPDFCESPTSVSSSKQSVGDSTVFSSQSEDSAGIIPMGITDDEAVSFVNEGSVKDMGNTSVSNKAPRRAAILRKR